MQNRQSNARYLGPIVFGEIQPAPEDQYQPTRPMYVEEPEQEPDPEELPDQDWVNQKTEYEL